MLQSVPHFLWQFNLHIVETIAFRILMSGRDSYSLQFHTIYIYGTLATLVGSGETAHDSERILHKRFVLQGVLHIAIPLSVTIELTVITAIRRIGGIAGFMPT